MNKSVSTFWFLSLALILSVGQGGQAEEGKGEEPAGVGPGKAVLEANKTDGFKLSEVALKNIEVSAQVINSAGAQKLPLSALVRSQEHAGVYRLRAGWFKFIEVKPASKAESGFVVQSPDIKPGDQVVTRGAEFLKLAELNIWNHDEGGE